MLLAVEQATDLLKAMANRRRLLLLCHMNDGEKSVGELARLIEARDTAVSQQLTLLRKDGLVRARRQGQSIYYSLASPEAAKVIEILHDLYCAATPSNGEQRDMSNLHEQAVNPAVAIDDAALTTLANLQLRGRTVIPD